MANKLCLNLSKTEYMLIGSRHNISNLTEKPCISVGDKYLIQVNLTESRGLYIDQFLSWNFHIENMVKKISSGIGAISRLKPFVCRDTLIPAYPNEHGQSNAAMAELGWETLKERRLQSKARLMYKITHGMAPTVLIELFST